MSKSCCHVLFDVCTFQSCLVSKLATLWQPLLSSLSKCGLRLNCSHSGTQHILHFGCHLSTVYTANGLLLQTSEEDPVHPSVIPRKGEPDFFGETYLPPLVIKMMLALLETVSARGQLKVCRCIRYLHQACWIPPHQCKPGFQPSHKLFTKSFSAQLSPLLFVGHSTFHIFQTTDHLTGSQPGAQLKETCLLLLISKTHQMKTPENTTSKVQLIWPVKHSFASAFYLQIVLASVQAEPIYPGITPLCSHCLVSRMPNAAVG